MIINIRGGNASSKSWVVRQIMAAYPPREIIIWRDGKKIEGYYLNTAQPTFVVGRYDGPGTGGCDTFKDMEDIEEIVLRYGAVASVIFEGIRVHGGHNRWIEFAKTHFSKEDYHFLILNTTFEQCKINMLARRKAVGNEKPLTLTNIEGIQDYYNRGRRQLKHFRQAGLPVTDVSSVEAVEKILEWLA
jgi:hypothetical protein